ncbi:MAG: GNAT family N-acetyltransferase [Ignavibacteriae bacterium]|nr:GNAT family N-acetyltransferase [Ignavibacteriota bacterium]
MIIYKTAETKKDYEDAKVLFLEFADSLNFNLCFQNFQKEIEDLPAMYSEPGGCLLLSCENEKPFGCVAVRKFEDGICEMKRLYIPESHRGRGIGRELAERIISKAKELGYKKMRLDTLETMKEAISLYKTMGFCEITKYRENPIKEVVYMEINL